jgi:Circularly permutated YpsA SLOG family
MPLGFLTESGLRLEFAHLYEAQELDSPEYAKRTRRNVLDSYGTLWFGNPESSGGTCTLSACRVFRKPNLVVPIEGDSVHSSKVAEWLTTNNIPILNLVGNRESTQPGIGHRVEVFLERVFGITQRGSV